MELAAHAKPSWLISGEAVQLKKLSAAISRRLALLIDALQAPLVISNHFLPIFLNRVNMVIFMWRAAVYLEIYLQVSTAGVFNGKIY